MDQNNIELSEYFSKTYGLKILNYCEFESKNVVDLNLSNNGITSISDSMLCQTLNLESIDLSHNLLTDLSNLSIIDLPQLKKLNLRDNQISDFTFLSGFKSLEELDIRGNNYDRTVPYWTVIQLPKLKVFNGEDVSEIRKYVSMAEIELISKIDHIFDEDLDQSLKRTESGILNMKTTFIEKVFHKCGVVDEAKYGLKQKVEQFIDKKLNDILNDITRRVSSTQYLSNNIVIKQNNSQTNGSIDITSLNGTIDSNLSNDIELDLLAKAIAETIGDLRLESSGPTMTSTSPSDSGLKSFDTSLKSDKTNENRFKRRLTTTEEQSNAINSHKKTSSSLSYQMIQIFRKHSRKTEPNDRKTPIWDIKFKPITRRYTASHIVVTCGGNIVNLIDLKNGSVCRTYEDSNDLETFNCIVWREFVINTKSGKNREISLLCVGGTKLDNNWKTTNIVFINADNMNDYFKMGSHSNSINCLLFHPKKRNYLFSGSYDRKIIVWTLDLSKVTSDSRLSSISVKRLMEIEVNNRILSSVFASKLDVLVVSGEDGIQLVRDPTNATIDSRIYRLELPEKSKLVDGLVLIDDNSSNLMAFRYKQRIIVTDLEKSIEDMKITNSEGVLNLAQVTQLRYCQHKCNYFYMSIQSRLLCCGDANGQILLYYLKDSLLKGQSKQNMVEPFRVLTKPQVNNCSINSETILKPTEKSFFINIAAVSPNHEYVVGGTNTNLIFIWKRTHTSHFTSHSTSLPISSDNHKKLKTGRAL